MNFQIRSFGIKEDKDNYVIAMYSTEVADKIIISEDNDVQVTLVGRQVIVNWKESLQPDDPSCSYGPLNYRDIEEEIQDDIRNVFTVREAGSDETGIEDFTISGSNLVDGTIDVNYTGILPADIVFNLEIEEDSQLRPDTPVPDSKRTNKRSPKKPKY